MTIFRAPGRKPCAAEWITRIMPASSAAERRAFALPPC